MGHSRVIRLVAMFVVTSLASARAATPATPPSAKEDWKLVWSDEFDQPGRPDPTKWGYETGFVRNHEPQFYTVDRPENARVEDGCLVIEARKEAYPPAASASGGSTAPQYTSASLTTLGKAQFLYGRFVARAKVPGWHGTWPAFWMLGVDRATVHWPACGEIDTMEFFSQRPKMVKGSVLFINKNKKFQSVSKDHAPDPAPADAFHTFECRWYPDRIDLYCDDIKYNTMHVDDAIAGDANPFHKPMYLLLNMAMGSSSGKIDNGKLPAKYLIDYVRVYQLK